MLRRLAFIRAARTIGVGLDEVREGLDRLPDGRTPTKADWTRLSQAWRGRLDEQINALVALRDGLDSCIGCGCLSLKRCGLYNPDDRVAKDGAGARLLPPICCAAPPRTGRRGAAGSARPYSAAPGAPRRAAAAQQPRHRRRSCRLAMTPPGSPLARAKRFTSALPGGLSC